MHCWICGPGENVPQNSASMFCRLFCWGVACCASADVVESHPNPTALVAPAAAIPCKYDRRLNLPSALFSSLRIQDSQPVSVGIVSRILKIRIDDCRSEGTCSQFVISTYESHSNATDPPLRLTPQVHGYQRVRYYLPDLISELNVPLVTPQYGFRILSTGCTEGRPMGPVYIDLRLFCYPRFATGPSRYELVRRIQKIIGRVPSSSRVVTDSCGNRVTSGTYPK